MLVDAIAQSAIQVEQKGRNLFVVGGFISLLVIREIGCEGGRKVLIGLSRN